MSPTSPSDTELVFLRLLERTKMLCSANTVEKNCHKIQASAGRLEGLLQLMDQHNAIGSNKLVMYTRELNQLRIMGEVAAQKSVDSKLSTIERIPKFFPSLSSLETESKQTEDGEERARDTEQLASSNEIRLKSKANYEQEMRDELFVRKNPQEPKEVRHDELQEQMAEELLTLTRSLKENMKTAGSVIKDDNQRLVRMQHQVDSNEERLAAESTRLARHAYKCGFDCALVFVVFFIFVSFVWMVLVMKVFPKKIYQATSPQISIPQNMPPIGVQHHGHIHGEL